MSDQLSTDAIIEVLKRKNTYAEAFEEIQDMQYVPNLSEYLRAMTEERRMKPAEIMRRSGLKKSYFYQLFDGERKNPKRDVLIQLGFGFQMSFDEVQEFLKHLGAAQLYPRIARDGAIIYALQHGMDIIECDILLEENGEEPLVRV